MNQGIVRTLDRVLRSYGRRRGVQCFCTLGPAVALFLFLPGCGLGQRRFATPDEAARAFVAGIRAQDREEVRRILGRASDEIVDSGDEVADRNQRTKFLEAYDRKNSLTAEPDGSVTLVVGPDDWPMPIPIVRSWGSWRFDTPRGKDEILNRRIGRNELSVREVCLAIVDAQREYAATDRNGDGVPEYAQKVLSDPGQRDGLYWETSAEEPPSPLGLLVADAVEEGYAATDNPTGERRPFHGYRFKLLTAQGPNAPGGARDYIVNGKMTDGFAIVAWPAEYGNSGVMTFLVSHQGVVYERNLGRRTERIASAMTVFDPDAGWSVETE